MRVEGVTAQLTSRGVRVKLVFVSTRAARNFFQRPTRTVARELLGYRLVRRLDGQRLSGIIVETEAYIGETDLACHCRHGRTPRTEVMFGKAGVSYVYFVYGVHWMLNVVTEREGFPAAVLIRALEPLDGLTLMQKHRGGSRSLRQLCSGPAKLTQALRIDEQQKGVDLCVRNGNLWLEEAQSKPQTRVRIGRSPRIGIERVPEPWRSKPWRYFVKDNEFVSR